MDSLRQDIVLSYLQDMRTRLEPEGAWTQWVFARDGEHEVADIYSPDATSWCINGAMLATAPSGEREDVHAALLAATGMPEGSGLSRWNDQPDRTQQEVLDLIDRAIMAIRAGGDYRIDYICDSCGTYLSGTGMARKGGWEFECGDCKQKVLLKHCYPREHRHRISNTQLHAARVNLLNLTALTLLREDE